ncbi:MAG: hypothetical protein VX699_12835 [Myxococcota bacterium]|nr:hypothetical protein [Myxococcota bacterium]
MPNSLTTRFNEDLTRFIGNTNSTPAIVDTRETGLLVEDAFEANIGASCLCGLVKGSEGSDALKAAFDSTPESFPSLPRAMVHHFISTGRPFDKGLLKAIESFKGETLLSAGDIDRGEALTLVRMVESAERPRTRFGVMLAWLRSLFRINRTPKGVEELKQLRDNAGDLLTEDAKKILDSFIKTGKSDFVSLEWKSHKTTWRCHWFPMKAQKLLRADRKNNLFAKGGALEKYDQVFDAKSREYEMEHNYRSYFSRESDADWAGHCNNSSEVSCMLDEPKKPVTYKGVTFSPHDISGLLVKVSGSLRGSVDFVGERYNSSEDDKHDPAPHVFLSKVLQAWGGEAEAPVPFVLDVTRKKAVWNYPYDQGRVTESTNPPRFFDESKLPKEGYTVFYRAELRGTAYEKQARDYRFWIQYANDGSVIESAWIKGADKKVNPDFAWRPQPVGDLAEKANWVTRPDRQNNPLVRAEDVYEIYRRSL